MENAIRRSCMTLVDALHLDKDGERLDLFLCAVNAKSQVLRMLDREKGETKFFVLSERARRETRRAVKAVRDATRGKLDAGKPRAILVHSVELIGCSPSHKWGAELSPEDEDEGEDEDEDE
jgi:hypothetical protein